MKRNQPLDRPMNSQQRPNLQKLVMIPQRIRSPAHKIPLTRVEVPRIMVHTMNMSRLHASPDRNRERHIHRTVFAHFQAAPVDCLALDDHFQKVVERFVYVPPADDRGLYAVVEGPGLPCFTTDWSRPVNELSELVDKDWNERVSSSKRCVHYRKRQLPVPFASGSTHSSFNSSPNSNGMCRCAWPWPLCCCCWAWGAGRLGLLSFCPSCASCATTTSNISGPSRRNAANRARKNAGQVLGATRFRGCGAILWSNR
jgi:hypothetical protein